MGECAICLDQCQRSRSNYRHKEIEEGESQNSLKHWTECSVLNSLVRNARTNFGRQHLHIMSQSMLKECVVKVLNESEDETYSQDNLCLERTRSNTPKYLVSWRLRRLVQFLGNRDQNCRCGFLTHLHHRVAIGRMRNDKDEKHMQKNHTRTTVRVRRPRRKIHEAGNCELHTTKFINSLQMLTWDSKEYDGEVYTLKKYDGELDKRSPTIGNDNPRWTRTQIQNCTHRHHRESDDEHASGKREEWTHTSDDWWKGNYRTKSGREKIKKILKVRRCSLMMVVEWWFFEFSVVEGVVPTVVRTHVVATTVCATGCVHTLTCCTYIFCSTYTARTLRTFLCVLHTCMAQGCLRCACRHLSVISPSPFLMFHPSLLLLVPWRSLRDHSRLRPRRLHWRSRPHLPAELSRPKIAGQAHSARGRAFWLPGQVRPQHIMWMKGTSRNAFALLLVEIEH